MRIAHFIHRYPPALGGSEAYFERLGRYLVAAGHQVTVFTTAALDLEAFWSSRGRCFPAGEERRDGVQVRRFPVLHLPGRRVVLKALSLVPYPPLQRMTLPCNPIAWSMWRAAGDYKEQFDLVHATAFPYAWPIACGLRMARRLRVPFLLTPFLHLGDPDDPRDPQRRGYLQPALRSLLDAADRIFVQTTVEYDALVGLGFAADQIVLQGMGVDPADCTGGDRWNARERWNVAPDEVVIGHLANQSVEKGSVDLLRSAKMLWDAGRRFRIVVAGPEMHNFRRFWDNYAAKSRVVRLGVLSETHKRDFFAGIDLFALPSRSDSFGLVLLEAWAHGVPSVAYRAGGVAGVIRHEVDGLLVPCGAIEQLAAALGRLIEGTDERAQFGRRGCDRLAAEFRWEGKLELVHAVCRAVTSRRIPQQQEIAAALPIEVELHEQK